MGSNVTSYTHTSTTQYPIRCGQKYTYTVRAYNNNTKKLGGYDAVGLSAYTVPSTVTLKSAVQNTDGTVTVSWDRAYGGDYYRIYRKTTSSPSWTPINAVESSSFSCTDVHAKEGEKNTYTVRMYNSVTNVAGGYDAKGVSVTIPEKEPEVTPTPDPEEPEMSNSEMAQEVIRLTNEERAKRGIAPLQYSPKLANMATIYAKEDIRSFNPEEFSGIWCVSETYYTPRDTVDNWMRWGGHRGAILDSSFTHTGVGIYKTQDSIYWIQLFTDYDPEQIFHVTLDPNGGICDTTEFIVESNYHLCQEEIPVPTREGYTFKGWAYRNEFFTSFYVREDLPLTAVWETGACEEKSVNRILL